MARKSLDLDTPFRKGERVVTTRDLGDIASGSEGRIQLRNGLGNWIRYWVHFEDGRQMGQVDHNDLTRPDQVEDWLAREASRAEAAQRSAEEATAAAADTGGEAAGGAGGGIASQIPADLLERSKAAKARLLGG